MTQAQKLLTVIPSHNAEFNSNNGVKYLSVFLHTGLRGMQLSRA